MWRTSPYAERLNSARPRRGLKPTRDLPANPRRFAALAEVILLSGDPFGIQWKDNLYEQAGQQYQPTNNKPQTVNSHQHVSG